MSRPLIAAALLMALWPMAGLGQDKPGEKPNEAAKAPEPVKAGDAGKARAHYAAAVELAAEADPVRPEVAEARAYLASAR